MKKFIATTCVLLVSVAAACAGGVSGKVSNKSGSGRSGVSVVVKLGYQEIKTTTDRNGNFVIVCPDGDSGSSAKVYVNGRYATTVKIPVEGYATVNVNYSK